MKEQVAVTARTIGRRREILRRATQGRGMELLEQRRLLAGDISGHVFNDLDGNGSQGGGEGNLENYRVYLDLNENEEYDNGEPNVFTNAGGNYLFEDIVNGDYTVRLAPPENWVITTPVGGGHEVTVNDDVSANQDFGTRLLVGAIQGSVYRDMNGNGERDGGEAGLQNYRVYIDDNDNGQFDGGEYFIFTPAGGEWEIGNLPPGDYIVRVDPGEGFRVSEPVGNRYEVTLAGNDTEDGYAFGIERIEGTVRGTVFVDTNGNGMLDPGEQPAENIQVYVDIDESGDRTQDDISSFTDALGRWQFQDLAPGDYTIRIELGNEWTSTTPLPAFFNTTVIADQDETIGAFGITPAQDDNVTIAGTVFIDVNENGTFNAGTDIVGSGWTVYRDLNGNGSRDDGEPSTTTGLDGSWVFSHLSAGQHTIGVVVQPGYEIASPANGRFVVTLAQDGSSIGNQFILHNAPIATASISGLVFNDTNGNGTVDQGESGRVGVTAYLDTNNNGQLDQGEASTNTDNSGFFVFDHLVAGTYNVRIVGVDGYSLTVPNNGVYNRVLAQGGTSTGNQFGLTVQVTPEFVNKDFNGDGKPDLIFRDSTTNATTVWYMNGLNRTGTATLEAVGPAWSLAATGDFNGDNKTDLVWHNNATGETILWLMDGVTRTQAIALPTVNPAWRIYGAGDFDNDGNTDILFRNTTSGSATVWYMNGTQLRANNSFGVLPQVTDQNWQIAAVDDFDGDGEPDILWTNATEKRNSLWRMHNTAVKNDGFRGIAYPAADGWRLATTSDFNNDGTPDLLWANGNNNSVWLVGDVEQKPVPVSFTQLAPGLVVP